MKDVILSTIALLFAIVCFVIADETRSVFMLIGGFCWVYVFIHYLCKDK